MQVDRRISTSIIVPVTSSKLAHFFFHTHTHTQLIPYLLLTCNFSLISTRRVTGGIKFWHKKRLSHLKRKIPS